MHKTSLAILICLITTLCQAADNHEMSAPADSNVKSSAYQGFSGGMMLHAGYMFGKDNNAPVAGNGRLCSPQGATLGIGGSMYVHLFKHLRIGAEGFVSTMYNNATDMRNVLGKGSYLSMGYGGLSADACWRTEKLWPYIGGTIGGGVLKGLYIVDGNQDDWQPETNSTFHKHSFFYIAPYAGFNYCMTKRVHLTLRLDWMLAVHKRSLQMPTGPRLYVGFMFVH